MRRFVSGSLFAAALASGFGQDAFGQALPPGHPTVQGSAASAAPGATAAPSAAPLGGAHPAHPPMGGGFRPEGPPEDVSTVDPSLPTGSIVVDVVDGQGAPLSGVAVQLLSQFESIAEGKSQSQKQATTDASGRVTFSGLGDSLHLSHRVRIDRQGARTEVEPFSLGTKGGQRVLLHVYPVTHDIREAFVGMRGFAFVEQRDGNFVFDLAFRVINMSQVTWLPKDVVLTLPKDATPLDLARNGAEKGFVEGPKGVELVGTYPPGQKDVQFQFQVPIRNRESESFELGLPPHLVELRVLAEQTPGLRLGVPGFDDAEPTRGPDGKRMLFTRRVMQPGQDEMSRIRIDLAGLPVPGPARYIACALALCVAAAGVFYASRRGRRAQEELAADRAAAERVLLDELLALERSHRSGLVGPKTYEQGKRELLNALSRLTEPTVAPQ